MKNISIPCRAPEGVHPRCMSTTAPARALHLLLVLSLVAAGCGASVTPAPEAGDAGSLPPDAPSAQALTPAPGTASCAEVRAACGAEPQTFVRGHAAGLAGLEGARVRFAMRYLLREGDGLNVPHGVVSAAAEVRGGAFEACVCMPRGGSGYPQVAAVAFAPGSTGETGREVARAVFSQRYATLGDEDLTMAFGPAPTVPQAEAALAGLSDRSHSLRVRGLDRAAEGLRAFAGLVADERPVAAQVLQTAVEGGALALDWIMPGRHWSSERLVLVIDRNGNARCDEGDLGATVRLDGRRELDGVGAWAEGGALRGLCQALSMEDSRER